MSIPPMPATPLADKCLRERDEKNRVEFIKQLHQSGEITTEVACKYLPEGETKYFVEIYGQKRETIRRLREELDEAAKDLMALIISGKTDK